MTKYACPTVGCGSEAVSPTAADKHLKRDHIACSCGWAGTSFAQHVGQRLRRVNAGYKDPGLGRHEPIKMEFDADKGRWMRISTPGGYKGS